MLRYLPILIVSACGAPLVSEVPPAESASSTVFLSCETEDSRAAEPITNYRIDPVAQTWSWWNVNAENDIPQWEVFSCQDENEKCTFEDTLFSRESIIGDLYAEQIIINRITGEMQRKTYMPGNGWLDWKHKCKSTSNPADALKKKF